jgi:ceramide glucosyltransferase
MKRRWLKRGVFGFLCAVHLLNIILAALATLSCGLAFWQWLAARKFPLHQKVAVENFAPAISILKPLKGCDATTRESLQSWLKQDYAGPVEILFGVADENDPATEIVRALLADNPATNARLVVCQNLTGTNSKVAKLAQLEKLAAHDLILTCDADVRVPADFLTSFVTPLRDEKIALVNCFYRLANPTTTAMRWEAVAVNADFWSQVLQSQTLKPLDFALGAALLVRRSALAQIGGFAAFAGHLADDYQLGRRIAKNGHAIALCPVVVECWSAPMNWRQVWKHQLRWARTIRVCQPRPYFFSLLANASFWPLLWLSVSFTTTKTCCAPLLAIVFLLVRMVLAQNLQRRLTPERKLVSPAWLVLVKDVLGAALWLGAFAGNTVEWRGQRLKLRRDGTLVKN